MPCLTTHLLHNQQGGLLCGWPIFEALLDHTWLTTMRLLLQHRDTMLEPVLLLCLLGAGLCLLVNHPHLFRWDSDHLTRPSPMSKTIRDLRRERMSHQRLPDGKVV